MLDLLKSRTENVEVLMLDSLKSGTENVEVNSLSKTVNCCCGRVPCITTMNIITAITHTTKHFIAFFNILVVSIYPLTNYCVANVKVDIQVPNSPPQIGATATDRKPAGISRLRQVHR